MGIFICINDTLIYHGIRNLSFHDKMTIFMKIWKWLFYSSRSSDLFHKMITFHEMVTPTRHHVIF